MIAAFDESQVDTLKAENAVLQSKLAEKQEEIVQGNTGLQDSHDVNPEVTVLREELKIVQAKLRQETNRRKTYEAEVCACQRFSILQAATEFRPC